MHLWVTRPIEDAGQLRAQLIARGHQVSLEPLLRVEYTNEDDIELEDAQALIATSRNALRALAGRPEEADCKRLPLFVVGRGTAQVAQSMGFETVIEGPSNAGALLGLILNIANVNDGALIHLSAENVAYNLCEELRHLGYHVFQPVLYRTVKVTSLSDTLLRQLHSGSIDGILLFSGRTADAYVEAVNHEEITSIARQMTHYCLSQQVAERLSPLNPLTIQVSEAPNIQSMLALTERRIAP